MEKIVIVAYKPFPGKESKLFELTTNHWNILNQQKLVSSRKPIIVKSYDGTVVEIFGWKSKDAMLEAHTNAEVQKMWSEYSTVCEYVPIGSLEESHNLFSEFTPLN